MLEFIMHLVLLVLTALIAAGIGRQSGYECGYADGCNEAAGGDYYPEGCDDEYMEF